MSAVQQADPYAGISSQDYTHHLAFRSLVPGYGRTIQAGERKYDPHLGHGGQIHQVGGSKAD